MNTNRHGRMPSIDSKMFAIPVDGDDAEVESDTESLSSYAGSGESYNEDEFKPDHYLQQAFARAFGPGALDRAVVTQAQTSGMVNAKSQELETLQLQAQQRLIEVKQLFSSGMKTAKQVTKDLELIQRKIQQLNRRAAINYPIEYQQAQDEIKK